MSGTWIFDAFTVIGAECILPILIKTRRAVGRTLMLTCHTGVGYIVGVGRVTIADWPAIIVMAASGAVVAILLSRQAVKRLVRFSTSLHGNLTPQSRIPIGTDAMLPIR